MNVAIIDYSMGNLGSVNRAFSSLGAQVYVAEYPDQLRAADRIVLPGVGSFADGMSYLYTGGWVEAIQYEVFEMNKPLLGICLGMQLLASTGTEGGVLPGLDLISGQIVRLDKLGCGLRIPHVGWNAITLSLPSNAVLLAGIPNGTDFYFVHSYAFRPFCEDYVLAYTDYDMPVVSVVAKNHIFGTQFHPEKSSRAGFRLLRNFLNFKSC
jgi:glutamine amidotransferase